MRLSWAVAITLAVRIGAFRRVLRLLVILLGLLAAACTRERTATHPAAGAGGLVRLELQTDWYPQAEHGGFYQALARGFYREAGLEVVILPGGPGAQPMQKVAAGQVHLGLGRSDDVAVAAARGIPVVAVFALMQHDPQALLLHAENPINSFAELDGRLVMAVPGMGWVDFVQRRYGVRLKLTPASYNLTRFLADKDFIQQCFITNEPFFARAQGAETKTLLISDSGFDPYRVVFGAHDFVQRHATALQAFATATARGWDDYLHGDPTPGNALILPANPAMTPELLGFSIAAMKQHRLVTGVAERGERIGQLSRTRLAEQVNILSDLKLLDRAVSLDEIVAWDVLPAELRGP